MTTTYTYDADSQLTSESRPLATINYSYDADGNRIGGNNVIGPDNQLLSDGTWNYTYDADGNLIEKVGVSTGPTMAYLDLHLRQPQPDDLGRRGAGEHDAGERHL